MVRSSRARLLWALGVFAACGLGLCAASCKSATSPGPLEPRPVRELERWRVMRGELAIGEVVLLEIEDPRGNVRFYRAENASGQWLGYVDLSGRFFKRVPFRETEQFLGMYPMDDGLPLLFEVEGPLHLTELAPGGAREASSTDGRGG